MSFIDIIANYWGVIVAIVIGGGYYFTHKKTATALAKSKIKTLIFAAEKGAEDFVLDNGPAKLEWVVEKGYVLLPPLVKAFVSKDLFRTLVQSIFDEAKDFIEEHKKKV
jgi:hypothetical protein